MWDKSSLHCANTTREVIVETEANALRLIVTTCVNKESAEILNVEKDTPRHVDIFHRTKYAD